MGSPDGYVQVLIVPRYSDERKAAVLAKLSPPGPGHSGPETICACWWARHTARCAPGYRARSSVLAQPQFGAVAEAKHNVPARTG